MLPRRSILTLHVLADLSTAMRSSSTLVAATFGRFRMAFLPNTTPNGSAPRRFIRGVA